MFLDGFYLFEGDADWNQAVCLLVYIFLFFFVCLKFVKALSYIKVHTSLMVLLQQDSILNNSFGICY